MNKNTGYFQYFDVAWFEDNQYTLIWLLNKKLTRRWARWIFRILPEDCPINEKIVRIEPTAFWFGFRKEEGKDIQVNVDVRTHQKFSKRIYFVFKPIWWLFHFWDWSVARFVPTFNLGFDTLTVYPIPGTIADGDCRGTGSTFATARNKTTGSTHNTNPNQIYAAWAEKAGGSDFSSNGRAIYGFVTSVLGAGATVTAAVFSLEAYNNQSSFWTTGEKALAISGVTPAGTSELADNDYNINLWGSSRYADTDVAFSEFASSGVYKDWTLNATGLAAISKTGNTWIGSRWKVDMDNDTPTLSGGDYTSSFIRVVGSNGAGTTHDPKLVITYTPGSTFIPKMIIM